MAAAPGGGAVWPGKLGDTQQHPPGYSPHVAPSDLAVMPFFTLVDCVTVQVTPLVDAANCIWVCGTFRNSFPGVIKLSPTGTEVLRIRIEEQIVATPVLADGALCLGIDGGVAAAYGVDSGAERWTSKYAPGCGNDSWSMGYSQNSLVLAGKSNEALPWNDSVYGLDATSGAVRWRHQATLMIFFTPCLVHGAVVFQDMQCTVTSLRLTDGSVSWQEKAKPIGRSTGQAVAAKSLNMVFAAANRPGKKDWNLPYGGQGCLRAFDLWTGKLKWQRDFDLEANTTPAVSPSGPGGQPIVIVTLGASPGPPLKEAATGDCWNTRIVALDAGSGSQLWARDLEPWKAFGVRGSTIFNIYTPTAMTNPVVGGDGTVYVGWCCGGWVYALRGTDGEITSGCDLGVALQASPVIGPGMLVVASYQRVHIWRPWQDYKLILEETQSSFPEWGVEHFCPFKGGGECPGVLSYRAPTDVSKPAWSRELTGRRPHEFFCNSPVVDAQGRIYVTSRYNGLQIYRPDGTLSASVFCGTCLTTPALFGNAIFIGTGEGWVLAVDIGTLNVRWTRRYCCQANLDAGSLVAANGVLLVPGNASEIRNENKTMYCLDCQDGHTRWTHEVRGVGIVNSRPVVMDDFVVFADVEGGLYAVHLSDGSLLWDTHKDQAGSHMSCHLCAGEMSQATVFTTSLLRAEPRWSAPHGGKCIIRCHDAGSGIRRWEKVFEEECLTPPVVAPKTPPLCKPMLIVALGSAGMRPARLTEQGPDGSDCVGDFWSGRLVGLDVDSPVLNWSRSMPVVRKNCLLGNHADDFHRTPLFSSPVVGADGTVYVAWGGGMFLAIEGITGKLLSVYELDCAATGSPAIAPGMVCLMSAFRLMVWRDPALEEAWRNAAANEGDPRAAMLQSGEPSQDVRPEATLGLLRNLPANKFDAEALRPYEWAQEFLRAEPLRRQAEDAVVRREAMEEHKAGRGPFAAVKAIAKARRDASFKPKEASPVGTPPSQSPPPKPRAAPSAGATPKGASQAAPAQPAWLQALGAASLLMDEEEEAPPPQKPRWEVTGGKSQGGIVVRRGQDVNSPQLPNRIATGAVLEELEVSGDRLRFKKLKGDGPDSGWVSLSFQGKPLLRRL